MLKFYILTELDVTLKSIISTKYKENFEFL